MFDFPNYTYSAIVGIFAAIFGMCYPLLLQAIERINDKYESTRLSSMFLKESRYVLFRQILYISIFVAIVSPFFLSLSGNILWLHILLLSVAAIDILALMFSAIRLFQLVITYYNAEKLMQRALHPNTMLELLDVAIYAAKKNNLGVCNACMQNLWKAIYDIYLKGKDTKEKYDMIIWEILQKLLELSYRDDSPEYYKKDTLAFQLYFYEGNASGIDKRQYQIMWRTLTEHIKRNNEDWLLSYWEYADQHFSVFLKNLTTRDAKNQQANFKEFHIALGALIIYNEKLNWLRKIRRFTNSIPPHYYLIPCTFEEILNWLFHFSENLIEEPFSLAEKYPLGKHDGVRTENVFYKYVVKYLAYSLLHINEIDYNVRFVDPKQIPQPFPNDSSNKEKREIVPINESRIRDAKFLKSQVASFKVRNNKQTRQDANDLIEQYISGCKEQITTTLSNANIDSKKINYIKENLKSEFNRQSLQLITKGDSELSNGESTNNNSTYEYKLDNNDILEGTYRLSINLESIIIASICKNIQQKYYLLFLFNKPTNTFVIRHKDIGKALGNLDLTRDHFIISMNLNMKPRFATITRATIKDIAVSHSEFVVIKKNAVPYVNLIVEPKLKDDLKPLTENSVICSNLSSLEKTEKKLKVAVNYDIVQPEGVWKYIKVRIIPEITEEKFDLDKIQNIQTYIV